MYDKLVSLIKTKRMTLREIKQQVAKAHGYADWLELLMCHDPGTISESIADDMAHWFASAMIEEDRKDCAEKAHVKDIIRGQTFDVFQVQDACHVDWDIVADKDSILNRPLPQLK
jgi:hypothetical protein